MKSREELNKLKDEYKNLTHKFAELTEEEVKEVVGGSLTGVIPALQEIVRAAAHSPITHCSNSQLDGRAFYYCENCDKEFIGPDSMLDKPFYCPICHSRL